MPTPFIRDHAPTILESRPRPPVRKPRWPGWVTGIAVLLVLLLVIAATAIVLADDPPQDFAQPVPPEQVPVTGTFRSLTLFQPPLPMNPFPELPVYALADGSFVYDDRGVNYFGGAQAESFAFSSGGEMMAMSSAPPPSPCPTCPPCTNCPPSVTNSPPYSVAGLKLTIPVLTNGYVYTTIFEHDPARPYDLYYKTNLNLTNWTMALGALAGETNYWLLNTFTTDLFLRIAGGLDSDGDGLPDNWEALYGLNPHSAADAGQDPDGDGLTNLQEFQQGSHPTSAPAFQVLVTSPRSLLP